MRTKILSCAVMLALFPVVAMGACIKGGPFVCGGSVTINSMPQSENPIWTPPLASPSVTSSGILSAFYTSNMSQANPNSPQPSVAPCPAGYSGSNGTYQWSGKDNTGWVLTGDTGCVAPPPPPPPPVIVQPPVVSTPAVVAVNPSAAAQAAAQQAAAQQAAAQAAASANIITVSAYTKTVSCTPNQCYTPHFLSLDFLQYAQWNTATNQYRYLFNGQPATSYWNGPYTNCIAINTSSGSACKYNLGGNRYLIVP